MNLLTQKKLASFFVDNSTPDFLLIRPNGNPKDAIGFDQLLLEIL
tara:strand:+ start:405 stop:539 length:135 start_codon:yes stop_codon:yes gene_type:complete